MKNFLLPLFLAISLIAQAQNLPEVSAGKIIRLADFPSRFVEARNIDIWLPEGYSENSKSKKKYAVLYMHDGQMLYDANTTWNHQAWEVDEIADSLMKAGKVKDFIVVGIWNPGKNRHSNYFPQKPFDDLLPDQKNFVVRKLQESGKSNEVFQSTADNYLKFLAKELKPVIDKQFSVYTNRKNTFVAGSSMGGLISMYAICEYPQVFGGAACLSTHWPGIFAAENNPVPEAFTAYLSKHLPKPKNHKIYFDYGDQTLDAMYPSLQQKVDTVMAKKRFTAKNWKTQFFPGKDHSEKSWMERLPIPLEFLLSR